VHIEQRPADLVWISTLVIDPVTVDYEGKFKVVLKNNLGEAISAAQINIKRGSIGCFATFFSSH
jgi:hypothetical protein